MTFVEALLVKVLAALLVRLIWALVWPQIERRLLPEPDEGHSED